MEKKQKRECPTKDKAADKFYGAQTDADDNYSTSKKKIRPDVESINLNPRDNDIDNWTINW